VGIRRRFGLRVCFSHLVYPSIPLLPIVRERNGCKGQKWTRHGENKCQSFPVYSQRADKDKWINAERQRWANHFNIPISPDVPPGFPVNTLPIQRALASLELSHPQKVESAVGLFWENFWVQWNDPTKPENIQAILMTVLGSEEEARKVFGRTKTDEVKKALNGNTSKAFEDGAFGLPWFVGECSPPV
jgi:2-hydroxychromene-2-carboxylate isomerase